MNESLKNPFSVFKASYYTDEQISNFWVDMPGNEGFKHIIEPLSLMPMIIKGGKGSGKTHLMRFYSYHIQRIRTPDKSPIQMVSDSSYFGVYVRGSGVNPSRFKGDVNSTSYWNSLFYYYFDIWVSLLYLDIIEDIISSSSISNEIQKGIISSVLLLFDKELSKNINNVQDLKSLLHNQQREIDYGLNNLPFTGKFNQEILFTAGRLCLNLPKIFSHHIPELQNVHTVYLFDEFENYSIDQQIFINTLIRDSESPISIKVGVRNYGLKTFKTLSDGEENRENDEFKLISLDDQLRMKSDSHYREFSCAIIKMKLQTSAYGYNDISSVSSFFAEPTDISPKVPTDQYTSGINGKTSNKLLRALNANKTVLKSLGISNEKQRHGVVKLLAYENYPLIEKAAHFHFYQAWAKGNKDLCKSAQTISEQVGKYLNNEKSSIINRSLSHHKKAFLAQLKKDHSLRILYSGLNEIIAMSKGNPRHLITIMGHIFDAAIYNDEKPFTKIPITVKSQHEGIRASSKWFFDETRVSGVNSIKLSNSISMLAEIFRLDRFSDKPVESSLIAFYTNYRQLSRQSQEIIELATQWSLLIEDIKGRKDKNTSEVLRKFYINPLLSPVWELPTTLRGVSKFTKEMTNSIFDASSDVEFQAFHSIYSAQRNVPFILKETEQGELF